jgi:hypothetical protein
MANTGILRGREPESFLVIDLTGSTGRTLTATEFLSRTIRLSGTLGQSVTIRLPLSAENDKGITYCFENATSGGFTITVSPISGAGVAVPSGSAISAFYDGAAMVASSGGTLDGASVDVLSPVIGDALTWDGDGWTNQPGGSLLSAVILAPDSAYRNLIVPTADNVLPLVIRGHSVSHSTQAIQVESDDGSVIRFAASINGEISQTLNSVDVAGLSRIRTLGHNSAGIPLTGYGSESLWQLKSSTTLDQDAASRRVSWSTATHDSRKSRIIEGVYSAATFRETIRHDTTSSVAITTLGNGTLTGTARLHVRDDSNAELAILEGGGLFSSVFMKLGTGGLQAALRVYPQVDATSGAPLIGTGGVILRGRRWTGSASSDVDGWVRLDMTANSPLRYHLTFGVGALENMWIRQDGQITLGASTPVNNATTQPVQIAGAMFINADVEIGATNDFTLPTANGPKWGTAANQTQGWWGASPVAQDTGWSVTNVTTDRVFDANATTTDELADVLGSLINVLKTYGMLGG